jgi:nitrate/nitrite-specific signal transduction histidine kinase
MHRSKLSALRAYQFLTELKLPNFRTQVQQSNLDLSKAQFMSLYGSRTKAFPTFLRVFSKLKPAVLWKTDNCLNRHFLVLS